MNIEHKVSTTNACKTVSLNWVEDVLNHKVCTTDVEMSVMNYQMEQVLNQ